MVPDVLVSKLYFREGGEVNDAGLSYGFDQNGKKCR